MKSPRGSIVNFPSMRNIIKLIKSQEASYVNTACTMIHIFMPFPKCKPVETNNAMGLSAFARRLAMIRAYLQLLKTVSTFCTARRFVFPLAVSFDVMDSFPAPPPTHTPLFQNAAVESKIRPALDSLVDDADRDVRYFSRKAMLAVSAMG